MTDLMELASHVGSASRSDNVLDVLVEVELFQPDSIYTVCRANAAGTKVIYTRTDGSKETCWAPDWTASPESRAEAAEALGLLARVRAHLGTRPAVEAAILRKKEEAR